MAINRQISLLALTVLATLLAAVLIGAAIFGGGAKRTVASRSAAAFSEAQRKGEPVGEGEHGHGALSPGAKPQPEHGGHAGSEMKKPEQAEQGSGDMTGHDMSGRGMPTSSPSADAHAGHPMSPQGAPGSAARREGQRQEPAGGHVGMQHGGAPAAGTTRDPMAGAPVVPQPAPKAAEATPGQPALTLQPDPLDQPPYTSIEEAKRAAEMAQEMTGGHGMQGMQHGTTSYRQLDAGRDSVTPAQEQKRVAPRAPTSPDHGGMQHGSPPAASPKPPAVRKPPPSKPTPGAPPPAATHPPHHSGGSEATR